MKNAIFLFTDYRPNLSDLIFIKKHFSILKSSLVIHSETFRLAYYFKIYKKYPLRKVINDFQRLSIKNIKADIQLDYIYKHYEKLRFRVPVSFLEKNEIYIDYKVWVFSKYIYELLGNFNIRADINLIYKVVSKNLIKSDRLDLTCLRNNLSEFGIDKNLVDYIIKNLQKRNNYIYKDTIGYMEQAVFTVSLILFSDFENVYIPSDKTYFEKLSKQISDILNLPLPNIHILEKLIFPDLKGFNIYLFPERQIFVSDTQREFENKVFSISSDNKKHKKSDKGNPDNCNVFRYMSNVLNFNQLSSIKNECKQGRIGCVECRRILFRDLKIIFR